MRRFSLVSLLGAALLIAPSGAAAGTQVGQTVDPRSSNCTPEDTFLQTVSPNNRFEVPFDGVITSWSFLGGNIVPSPLKLKLGTVRGDTMTIVGESTFAAPAPGQMNTFATRVTARDGNLLGFSFPSPSDLAQCAATNQSGFADVVALGDIAPGQSATTSDEFSHLDISANLEPDCDKDGLGDETQDGDIGSCPPCKGQKATIVGTGRSDTLGGAEGRDVIVGLGGNDKLSGLGGGDIICGGAGKDVLKGGGGKDTLLGQAGRDTLKGGKGKDKLVGGPGKDKQVQ